MVKIVNPGYIIQETDVHLVPVLGSEMPVYDGQTRECLIEEVAENPLDAARLFDVFTRKLSGQVPI